MAIPALPTVLPRRRIQSLIQVCHISIAGMRVGHAYGTPRLKSASLHSIINGREQQVNYFTYYKNNPLEELLAI